ncbi:MAG: hypothetical protein KJ737_02390 [Proteobacteria bacterium]|nr:hypothetical protein [Pseudomonadota bacterium]
MKRKGLLFLVACLSAALTGCVLSVSPDTSETITMDPGQTQIFTIKTSGTSMYDHHFFIEISDDDTSNTIESNNFVHTTDYDTLMDTAIYTPNQESAGKYKVRFLLSTWAEDPIGEALAASANSSHSRTWKVLVRGVSVTPKQNISSLPGITLTYTAKAYPDGNYTYQWMLDDNPVGTGETYNFTPTLVQCGKHMLTVTATSDETVYTLSREIVVPLTKAGGGNHDDARCIHTTPDGGFILAGESYSTDIPDAINHGSRDCYVAKFDSSGKIEWQNLYGGSSSDNARFITPLSDGGYIVAGSSDSNDIPGAPLTEFHDIYILRIGVIGEVVWQKLYSCGSDEENSNFAHAVYPTIDENGFMVLGTMIMRLDGAGNMIWDKNYQGYMAALTPDNGCVIAGEKNNEPAIFKLDADGNELWYQPVDAGAEYTLDSFGGLVADGEDGFVAAINCKKKTENSYHNFLIGLTVDGAISSINEIDKTNDYNKIEFSALFQTPQEGYNLLGLADSRIYLMQTDVGGNKLSDSPKILLDRDIERSLILIDDIDMDGGYLVSNKIDDIYVFRTDNY